MSSLPIIGGLQECVMSSFHMSLYKAQPSGGQSCWNALPTRFSAVKKGKHDSH